MTAGTLGSLAADDGAMLDLYRVDATGPRRGGLVLLQEIFGLTEHIRETCDAYAAEGFDVVAPALFHREAPGLEAGYTPDEIARCVRIARDEHTFGRTVADVQSSIDLLAASGPVFVVGYCYGGSAAWAAACRCEGVTAAVSYYGSHVIRMVDETPRAPVMLHFGEQDAGIPPSDVDEIARRHPYAPIHIYPARHGFNSDRREDFHPRSARLARARTLSFFAACGADPA
jgi:carboxymethylenebutenolidase